MVSGETFIEVAHLATMGQLYRVDKIYSWKISDYPEYPEKMTDLPPFTDILHRIHIGMTKLFDTLL
jgi:hypothetical protein